MEKSLQYLDNNKALTDGFRYCSCDSWFQSVNENRYGFLQADNVTNVMSSADLVFCSGFCWFLEMIGLGQ